MASCPSVLLLNDFDRASTQTHYTQNTLAPSQVCHWSAFGSVCTLTPRIILLTCCSDWSGANRSVQTVLAPVSFLRLCDHSNGKKDPRSETLPLLEICENSPLFTSTCPSLLTYISQNRFWHFPYGKRQEQICIVVGCVSRWSKSAVKYCFFLQLRARNLSCIVFRSIWGHFDMEKFRSFFEWLLMFLPVYMMLKMMHFSEDHVSDVVTTVMATDN